MEGQPAKQNGNERGGAACVQQGNWGRSGEEASRTEQQRRRSSSCAPARARLVTGACSYLLISVFFIFPSRVQLMCCVVMYVWCRCFKLKSSVSIVRFQGM